MLGENSQSSHILFKIQFILVLYTYIFCFICCFLYVVLVLPYYFSHLFNKLFLFVVIHFFISEDVLKPGQCADRASHCSTRGTGCCGRIPRYCGCKKLANGFHPIIFSHGSPEIPRNSTKVAACAFHGKHFSKMGGWGSTILGECNEHYEPINVVQPEYEIFAPVLYYDVLCIPTVKRQNTMYYESRHATTNHPYTTDPFLFCAGNMLPNLSHHLLDPYQKILDLSEFQGSQNVIYKPRFSLCS